MRDVPFSWWNMNIILQHADPRRDMMGSIWEIQGLQIFIQPLVKTQQTSFLLTIARIWTHPKFGENPMTGPVRVKHRLQGPWSHKQYMCLKYGPITASLQNRKLTRITGTPRTRHSKWSEWITPRSHPHKDDILRHFRCHFPGSRDPPNSPGVLVFEMLTGRPPFQASSPWLSSGKPTLPVSLFLTWESMYSSHCFLPLLQDVASCLLLILLQSLFCTDEGFVCWVLFGLVFWRDCATMIPEVKIAASKEPPKNVLLNRSGLSAFWRWGQVKLVNRIVKVDFQAAVSKSAAISCHVVAENDWITMIDMGFAWICIMPPLQWHVYTHTCECVNYMH